MRDLKEDLSYLESIGASKDCLNIYEYIFNGLIDEIPEDWLDKEFNDFLNLKYDNIVTKYDNYLNSSEVYLVAFSYIKGLR